MSKPVEASLEAKKKVSVKKQPASKRIKNAWSTFCVDHPWLARFGIALLVCAILWAILWFLLFSGMNESADFIYAQF